MRLKDMSEIKWEVRNKFIYFLRQYSWIPTEIHGDVESGEYFHIDAQLFTEVSNRSTASLIQEYDQILFEAQFDTFILRLSTRDCNIEHSRKLVKALPHLKDVGEVMDFLSELLDQNIEYTIGANDDFEPLSSDTINEFKILATY
jgi:hypothetical protein